MLHDEFSAAEKKMGWNKMIVNFSSVDVSIVKQLF